MEDLGDAFGDKEVLVLTPHMCFLGGSRIGEIRVGLVFCPRCGGVAQFCDLRVVVLRLGKGKVVYGDNPMMPVFWIFSQRELFVGCTAALGETPHLSRSPSRSVQLGCPAKQRECRYNR